jgi:hypothetical protein
MVGMYDDEEIMQDYHGGYISFDDLPKHLQDYLHDEYLWAQADAMYDMMQEEDY